MILGYNVVLGKQKMREPKKCPLMLVLVERQQSRQFGSDVNTVLAASRVTHFIQPDTYTKLLAAAREFDIVPEDYPPVAIVE
jgi:hypothetical protein